ncbi:MAG: FlgD immunoglobulin-like domain containing protein [bacterium]
MRVRVLAVVCLALCGFAGTGLGVEVGMILKAVDEQVEVDTVRFLSPIPQMFVTAGFAVEPGEQDTHSFGEVIEPTKVLFSWQLAGSRKEPYQVNELQFSRWYDFPRGEDGPFAPPQMMFVRLETGVEEGVRVRPSRYAASPNPFRTSTDISDHAGRMRVEVCDRAGRVVRTLEGTGRVTWDGRDTQGRRVEAGVYLVRPVDGSRPGAVLVLAR